MIGGRRGWLLFAALILLGAFAARLWRLDAQSLWHDEAWSVFSAYQPFAPPGPRGSDPNAPFAFYTSLHLWMAAAGDSVWAMRYWSLLFGVVTVAVTGRIAGRWFGHRAGLLAMLFVGASPILWVFSQEIRAYVTMPLAALILLFLVDALLRAIGGRQSRSEMPQQVRRIWLALLGVELLTLYAHNLSVPIVAWLNVTVVAALLLRRAIRPLAAWLAGQAALLVLYLPWLLSQQQTGGPLNTPPALSPVLLWDIWQSYFTGIKAMLGADPLLATLTAGFGVFALAGALLALARSRTQRLWLLLSQVVLLPIFQLAIILAARIDLHPRYFILGVPATLILTAAGWAGQRVANIRSVPIISVIGHLRPGLAAAAAILAIAILVRMTTVLYSSPVYQHDDFRAIAARYAALGGDDAVVIPYGWEPTLDYYRAQMGIRAAFIDVPIHSPATVIIDRMLAEHRAGRRVELLTWYQLPADMRGAYTCLLEATGEAVDSLTVSGLHTQTFVLGATPQRSEPEPEPVDFPPLRLTGAEAITSGANRACAITHWTLAAPTRSTWRVAFRVLNPLGWEIGATDTDLLTDAQLPTPLWEPGDTWTAFALLEIPASAPPDAYPITAATYDALTRLPVRLPATIGVTMAYAGGATDESAAGSALVPRNVAPGVRLLIPAEGFSGETLRPGDTLRLTLIWEAAQGFSAQIALAGSNWQRMDASQVMPPPSDQPSERMSWHALRVPAEASGRAVLRVAVDGEGPVWLAEYPISPVERRFDDPGAMDGDVDLPADETTTFPGVGRLVRAALPEGPIQAGQPFAVRLLWEATHTPEIAYTVFVHLRAPYGAIIAQSDRPPADGVRPTTGWIAGEYIQDVHRLAFNDTGYRGAASLVVGLYDPATGERVSLSSGDAFARLPMPIQIE
jgi:hypothetical protein